MAFKQAGDNVPSCCCLLFNFYRAAKGGTLRHCHAAALHCWWDLVFVCTCCWISYGGVLNPWTKLWPEHYWLWLTKHQAPAAVDHRPTASCSALPPPTLRFWINNQSRMYLLEGTADLQHHYHLKMGDVLIFAQKDDKDKTVVLAGRPATRADAMRKAAAARKPSPTPAGGGSGKGSGKGGKDVSGRLLGRPPAKIEGSDFTVDLLWGEVTAAAAVSGCHRSKKRQPHWSNLELQRHSSMCLSLPADESADET